MQTTDKQIEHVRDLARNFPTAMLVTHTSGGGIHARPMEVAEITDACEVWFFNGADSAKTAEIEQDKATTLIFQKDHSAYLTITGSASLTSDRTRIAELWKETYKVWFPGGQDDPNLVLIAFRPERAEYWDTTGSKKFSYLWETAAAYFKGTKPAIQEGEQHGVVEMA